MSDEAAFDWTPERIVVPNGQPWPFQTFDSVWEGVSGHPKGNEDDYMPHLTLTFVEDAEGTDLEEAFVIVDQSELPDADVLYVWRRGPFVERFDFQAEPAAAAAWGNASQAFMAGFIMSRMQLLKTRFGPDYELDDMILFWEFPWTKESVRNSVAEDNE